MKVRKPRLAAFRERLTKAWQASGMTRCELAKRLGYDQAMVSHWMLGRSEPGLACLVEMAGVLGVTPGYLLGQQEVTPGYLLGQQDANHRVVRSKILRIARELEDMAASMGEGEVANGN